MNYFILQTDDYAVMAQELERLYLGNNLEIASQFHIFFRDTLENWPEFKTIVKYLENKDFSAFPNVTMDNLVKYKFWPRGDDYPMQEVLFHHFIKKGVDISQDFGAIASQQSEDLGPFQGKYAVMYSEGLIKGQFKGNSLIEVYDYLSDRNTNHIFTDRLLYILFSMVDSSNNKSYIEIFERLNPLLRKDVSSQNPYLIKIIDKIKNEDLTHYTYIKKAVLFKDGYCVEKEGLSLSLTFNLEQMHENFNIDKNKISWSFDALLEYYRFESQQNNSKLVDFFGTNSQSLVTIVATFETIENKNKWKKEIDFLLEAAKNQGFGNLDVKDIILKSIFAMELEEKLSTKNHKEKIKKI